MQDQATAEYVRQTMELGRPRLRLRAIFMATIGIVFPIAKLADPTFLYVSGLGATGNWVVIGLASALMIGGAAWSLQEFNQADASERPAVVALREAPARIVWIYTVNVMMYRAHHYTDVYFCFEDGTHDVTRVASAYESDLLATLTRRCPRATQGFSDELAARYRRDPRSLLRAD